MVGRPLYEHPDEWTIDGIDYRLVRGRKGPTDMRLEWRPDPAGDWRPVVLDHALCHVAVIAANEDRLYPYPQKGGAYVNEYLRMAQRRGWHRAVDRLHRERANKADR